MNNIMIINLKQRILDRLVRSKRNSVREKLVFKFLSLLKDKLFSDSKFIKIDTDGFDCSIIRSEIEFIKKHKPVIFFEYDPYFLSNIDDDGVSVFNTLYKAGYSKMIIYENTGEYLLSVELNQEQIIEDIHMFYSSRKGEKYCDICVFHKEDDDIWSLIRGKELEFFSENKN